MTTGKLVLLCFVLLLMFKAMGPDKPRVNYAEKYGLTPIEATAFRACNSQMSGKKLSIKGRGTVWPVPKEICACQSKNMVMTFNDGKYRSHKNIVTFLSDEPGQKTLRVEDLRNPASPEAQFMTLALSAVNCVAEFQADKDEKLEEHIIKNPDICNSSNGQIGEICGRLRKTGRI